MASESGPDKAPPSNVAPGPPERALRLVEADARHAWGRMESIHPVGDGASSNSGWTRVVLFAVVVAVAAAGLLTAGFRADSKLSYELRGASADNGVIEARRGEATVALSDGSAILAENGTKFSVDVIGRNAALTRLVSGKLHVRVAHHEDTSYRFTAGPYELRVVGTEFDFAWDPSGAGLSVVMSKGKVQLVEPGGQVRALQAGQSLRLAASPGTVD